MGRMCVHRLICSENLEGHGRTETTASMGQQDLEPTHWEGVRSVVTVYALKLGCSRTTLVKYTHVWRNLRVTDKYVVIMNEVLSAASRYRYRTHQQFNSCTIT